MCWELLPALDFSFPVLKIQVRWQIRLVHYFLEAEEDIYEVSPISLLLWFSNSRSGAA